MMSGRDTTLARVSLAYEPKPYEIAGFDLFARLQDDGIYETLAGTKFKEFPPEVRVCGAVYTLEYVKNDENEGDPSIRWGIYV